MDRDLTIARKIALDVQDAIEEILCEIVAEHPHTIFVDLIDGVTTGLYAALKRTPIKRITCEMAARMMTNIYDLHEREHEEREKREKRENGTRS
jgi:hypothetical protein